MSDRNNKETGYWQVNGRDFYSKVEAALAATQYKTDIKYIFNNDVFDKINWSVEPKLSLPELYSLRAQQLRDQYRKVVLFYSGGSDAHTLLLAFLRSNIHIDEVVMWRLEGVGVDKQSDLTNAEQTYVGLDIVNELHKKNIKVTEFNVLDSLEDTFPDNDWIYTFEFDRAQPGAALRNKSYKKWFYENEYDQRDCVVFGLEKPRLFLKDGYWCTGFLDEAIMSMNHPMVHRDDWYGPRYEWFFTTPDMPEIQVKQVHKLIQHFIHMKTYDSFYYELVKDQVLTHTKDFNRSVFFPIANQVLYEDFWDEGKIFTLGKGPKTPGALLYFKDAWIWSPNTKYLLHRKRWMTGVQELQNQIDPKFFNGGNYIKGDMLGMYSNFYKVMPA